MRFHLLLQRADRVVRRTRRALPPPLREPAAALPVVFERAPGADDVDEGVAPDTLGLFVGPARHEDPGPAPTPSQIILFLDNIWDCTGEPALFDDEVRITYLHELGHYLGLGEEDLEARGLE